MSQLYSCTDNQTLTRVYTLPEHSLHKFVVFSDVHIHPYNRFSSILPDGRNSRVTIILKAIDKVYEYCMGNSIKTVFFLGDLFEARGLIQGDVFNDTFTAIEKFKNSNIDVYMLVGNHDLLTKNTDRHIIETFRTVAQVIDKPTYLQSGNLRINFLPFDDDLERIKKTLDGFEKGNSIVLGHVGTRENKIPGFCPSDGVPVGYFKDFKLVLLGHYHDFQVIDNVKYVGSLVQHDFGEICRDKGFFEVTCAGDDYNVGFIKVDSPKFITVDYKDIGSVSNLEGNYVRVVGKEDECNEVVKDTILKKGVKGVVFTTEKEYTSDQRLPVSFGMSLDKIVEEYVKMFRGDMEEDKLAGMGKQILLDALGRN